ncbi:SH2 domain-containing protein 5 [Spea bombifrons]|uniref:SH2 domain-containing protein 5 n=1 Tax=Spea bombifrons TaxID=233779 RepID=UPI00234ABDC4|nr:SH2 domain-containing protein 5 [Spea bombifrons]
MNAICLLRMYLGCFVSYFQHYFPSYTTRKTSEQVGPSRMAAPRARFITKFAEYVGSFVVKETDWRRRVWIIEEQMLDLKDCPRRRCVILRFCEQGVKMYDANSETLLMAHALRRIRYTTCRPEDCQFAFVSRNPRSPAHELFCHLFVSRHPSEAQVLNLLLCRLFQLEYLLRHPDVGYQEGPAKTSPQKALTLGSAKSIIREPLDPELVSQNINALVSFRRLPLTADPGSSDRHAEGSNGISITRMSSLENPYCSPTLVRKKAIRSKVLRSGAYRYPHYQSLPRREAEEPSQTGKVCMAEDYSTSPNSGQSTAGMFQSCLAARLSDRVETLMDDVWFYAGIGRDAGVSLLKNDRVGAFLLCADPEGAGTLTLFVRTQCGVIPYSVHRTPQGVYCLEHLHEDFPSLAALVKHHSGPDTSLFNQLAHGRVNPCFESNEPTSESNALVKSGHSQEPHAEGTSLHLPTNWQVTSPREMHRAARLSCFNTSNSFPSTSRQLHVGSLPYHPNEAIAQGNGWL